MQSHISRGATDTLHIIDTVRVAVRVPVFDTVRARVADTVAVVLPDSTSSWGVKAQIGVGVATLLVTIPAALAAWRAASAARDTLKAALAQAEAARLATRLLEQQRRDERTALLIELHEALADLLDGAVVTDEHKRVGGSPANHYGVKAWFESLAGFMSRHAPALAAALHPGSREWTAMRALRQLSKSARDKTAWPPDPPGLDGWRSYADVIEASQRRIEALIPGNAAPESSAGAG